MKSIKSKVLVFAVLATLIPSITLGWMSYFRNDAIIREKAAQQLNAVAGFASREIDLWLKERVYDLRVFASSYVVLESVPILLSDKDGPGASAPHADQERAAALQNLRVYLGSVRERLNNWNRLTVFDAAGKVLGSSDEPNPEPPLLPADWLVKVAERGFFASPPYWATADGRAAMLLAVPIILTHGVFSGALTAEIDMGALDTNLAKIDSARDDEIILLDAQGRIALSSRHAAVEPRPSGTPGRVDLARFRRGASPAEYRNYRGLPVLGVMRAPQALPLVILVEKNANSVFAELMALRNLSLALVGTLLLVVGLVAYLFGLSIVRPLYRLIQGARQVAEGDLEVKLPVWHQDELGYTMGIFNQMVVRLRDSREEIASTNRMLAEKNQILEELSVTDSLTGLHNRKNLTETLFAHYERYKRNHVPFSVLMLDIDHFKKVNDLYGHLVGDAVLARVAGTIGQSIRSVDYAARYGGEEFLIILFETAGPPAIATAERIRSRVAGQRIEVNGHHISVTLSIGVSEIADTDQDPGSVIDRADTALYQAKKEGRNRALVA